MSFNQDRILMYCSYFSYGKAKGIDRKAACDVKAANIIQDIQSLERNNKISAGASDVLANFFNANDSAQSVMLDNPENQPKDKIHLLIRSMFQIIE